jgi:hypothetical protein
MIIQTPLPVAGPPRIWTAVASAARHRFRRPPSHPNPSAPPRPPAAHSHLLPQTRHRLANLPSEPLENQGKPSKTHRNQARKMTTTPSAWHTILPMQRCNHATIQRTPALPRPKTPDPRPDPQTLDDEFFMPAKPSILPRKHCHLRLSNTLWPRISKPSTFNLQPATTRLTRKSTARQSSIVNAHPGWPLRSSLNCLIFAANGL